MTIEELEAKLETVTRERDEARREADRFRHGCTVEGDFVCPNEYAVSELTAERNFLRALKKNHEEDFARVCKERDEARAEAEAAAARAETVQRLDELNMAREYRRGAEAMREACAAALMADGLVLSRERAANVVRALPIPEEP